MGEPMDLDDPSFPLLDLPTELQFTIFDHIKAPADLNSLCRACKALRDSVTPLLYDTVTINVPALDPSKNGSLRPTNSDIKNPNLKKIRYLEIKEIGAVYQNHTHNNYLRDLLRALVDAVGEPDDTKSKIRFIWIDTISDVGTAIDRLVLRLLSKSKMLVIHAGGLPNRLPGPLPTERLENITTLALFIKTQTDVIRHSGVIQQLPNLIDLSIIICSFFIPLEQQQIVVSNLNIVKELFYPTVEIANVSAATATKLDLQILYIDGLNFTGVSKWLVDSLNIETLEELALISCQGTYDLMDSLRIEMDDVAQRKQQEIHDKEGRVIDEAKLIDEFVRLRTFIDDRFQNWPNAGTPADDFLKKFRGLKKFRRTYLPLTAAGNYTAVGISWSSLQGHAETLEMIHVDNMMNGASLCWMSQAEYEDFQNLCPQLKKLEQLAVRPPQFRLKSGKPGSRLANFLRDLHHIKTLTSLKLILEDECLEFWDPRRLDPPSAAVYAQMQRLANMIFNNLSEGCPRFTALMLSVRARLARDPTETVDFGYLRRLEEGPKDEKWRTRGQFCEGHLMKYHEPCSDIFQSYTDAYWHLQHAKGEA